MAEALPAQTLVITGISGGARRPTAQAAAAAIRAAGGEALAVPADAASRAPTGEKRPVARTAIARTAI